MSMTAPANVCRQLNAAADGYIAARRAYVEAQMELGERQSALDAVLAQLRAELTEARPRERRRVAAR